MDENRDPTRYASHLTAAMAPKKAGRTAKRYWDWLEEVAAPSNGGGGDAGRVANGTAGASAALATTVVRRKAHDPRAHPPYVDSGRWRCPVREEFVQEQHALAARLAQQERPRQVTYFLGRGGEFGRGQRPCSWPVKKLALADGGLDVQVLNAADGSFVRDLSYLSKITMCDSDTEEVSEDRFNSEVDSVRAALAAPPSEGVAAASGVAVDVAADSAVVVADDGGDADGAFVDALG